jgi:glucose/arabinose dehydrogenase
MKCSPIAAIGLIAYVCPVPTQASLIANGDFTDSLDHWSIWIGRNAQNDFAATVIAGRLHVSGSDINGGVYQQFGVTPGWVVTVTGYWQSTPTIADAMWAEVLVINADRVPAPGTDETDGVNNATLLYKNDTFSGRGAWDGSIPKTAPVKYEVSFVAAATQATLVLKTGNTGPATLTGASFDDIEVRTVPPAATMLSLPAGFAGRTFTFPVSNLTSMAQSPTSRHLYAVSNEANAADTRLYRINIAGASITATLVPGLGSLADHAQGLTFDPVGNLYVSTQYGKVIKGIDTNGDPAVDAFSFSTIVSMPPLQIGTFHGVGGVAVGPDGKLYINSGSESHYGYLGDGSLEVFEGRLNARILRCDLDGSNLEEFAAGIRNSFDITFRLDGKLFGVENGPNVGCDYADEFNMLDIGQHYGFPYKYGNDLSGSDSSHMCTSVGPSGPPPLPSGLSVTPAWANYGPDGKPGPTGLGYADGGVYYGFNPHSSPDGIDFYEPSLMDPSAIKFPAEFHGRAFVVRFGNLEEVPSIGYDLLSLRLSDADAGFTCNRFLGSLGRAVDALCAYNGKVYVLEYNPQTFWPGPGWGSPSKLYEIAYTVPTLPSIGLSTTAITRAVDYTQALPDETLTVFNAGGAGTLNFTVCTDQSWVSVSPEEGTSSGPGDPATITVSYATAGLPIGSHDAAITVADPRAANNPQTIAVTVNVKTVLPDFDADGDVDLEDFAYLQGCYSPFLGASPLAGCEAANLDGDNDVDPQDAVVFQNCLSAASVLAAPACDDAWE